MEELGGGMVVAVVARGGDEDAAGVLVAGLMRSAEGDGREVELGLGALEAERD